MADTRTILQRLMQRKAAEQEASKGWVYTMYSRVLDEIVILASDDAVVSDQDLVVYRERELELLDKHRPSREDLKAIHLLKKRLDGEHVEPTD